MGRSKAVVAALLLFAFIPSVSYGAVAVHRTDSHIENRTLGFLAQMQKIWTDLLTSIQGITAIKDLANFPDMIKGLTKNLDIQGLIGDLGGDLVKDLSGSMQTALKGADFGEGLFEGLDLNFDMNGIADVENFVGEIDSIIDQGLDKLKDDLLGSVKDDVFDGIVADGEETQEINIGVGDNQVRIPVGGEDGYTAEEARIVVTKAISNASKSMKNIMETIPYSQPQVMRSVVDAALNSAPNPIAQDQALLEVSEEGKLKIISQTGAILAPYVDDEKGYRQVINEAMKQNEQLASSAGELSGGGAGDALPTIAGLTATQVQQLAQQNSILINIADILADEVRLLGIIALSGAENYSRNLYESTRDLTEIYERTHSEITR